MKIIVTNYGFVHYRAGCYDCEDFRVGIRTTETPTAKDVRAAVLAHVRKTGHTCWIEAGKTTKYEAQK